MQVGLGLTHVRPLFDQGRGQADRQVPGQGQAGQVDPAVRGLAREPPRQDRQQVALLRRLLEQGRQGGLGLGQLGLLGREVEPVGVALGQLEAQDLDHPAVGLDQLPRRLDLSLQRRLLDRGRRDIGAEGDVGRDHLEPRRLGLGLEALAGAPVQAEHVGGVGDADLRREQAILEGIVAGRRGERLRLLLPRGRETGRDAGETRPALGQHGLARRGQGRLGGLEVVVVLQRLFDQGVQGRGMEQGPPVARQVCGRIEALSLAASDAGGGDGAREGRCGIGLDRRCGGPLEVGPDRAAGDAHTGQKRRQRARTPVRLVGKRRYD